MSDFRIQVDSLVSSDGTGAVSAGQGLNLNGSLLSVSTGVNVNVTGIATIGVITATSAVAGILTSSTFKGDGSQITGTPTFTTSKIIAYKYILSDPPLRS